MSKRPRRGDVVEVAWVDSTRLVLGWDRPRAYRRGQAEAETANHFTAGFFIKKTKASVAVALSMSPSTNRYSEAMCIPASAVTGLQVLGRADKRTRRAMR